MQLALFPPPPAPLQLVIDFPSSFEARKSVLSQLTTTTQPPKGPTMTQPTTKRRVGPLRRLYERIRYPKRYTTPGFDPGALWLLPSSTTELTPDDWRVIRLALQRAIVEHTAADRWPAAEAAQHTLDKCPTP